MDRSFRAVIFDLGGVVFDSPLHAIARFEQEFGIPPGHVNRVVVATGEAGAWSRLERGELAVAGFAPLFERECAEAGHPIDALAMMARIGEATAPRPAMLAALRALRARGFALAALTNNWESESGRSGDHAELRALFDAFVESAVVGVRKPDPRIYELACEALGVAPAEAVFLDDIGRNLKAARVLGMATIKVDSPGPALAELERVLGLAAGALAPAGLSPVVAAGND
jgi:putative hydrolase of the HAD superfamily